MDNEPFKVAILDMYDGAENQGMRSIIAILEDFAIQEGLILEYKIFNTRGNQEVPNLSYDAFISTGGPGSPLESEGSDWEGAYFNFVDQLRAHNRSVEPNKKPLFLICHSFQLFCRHYRLAKVMKRRSNSFGIFPIHISEAGHIEPFFKGLPDPFWAVDSRDYQVVKVDYERLAIFGARLLCREKIRPHVPLERAVMAVRFSDYIFGTQFHPEADPLGMKHYFAQADKRDQVIRRHGIEKYENMIGHLNDPDQIIKTRNTIIPNFLKTALHFKLVLADD